jgi:hypothetical protein
MQIEQIAATDGLAKAPATAVFHSYAATPRAVRNHALSFAAKSP